MRIARVLVALAACSAAAHARAADAPPPYAVTRSVAIGAPDAWDYLAFDAGSHRLYIAHGTATTIVDGRDGRVLGTLGPLEGAHGEVVDPSTNRVWADSGLSGTVTAFALDTGRPVARIVARPGADGMVRDPVTGRIFVVDGAAGVITVIDPTRNAVIATIAPGGAHMAGRLEFAAADGEGQLFVNLADAGAVARIDTRTLAVEGRTRLSDCVSPHGLAAGARTGRVFSSCENGVLAVLDARSGREVASLSIGQGSDAVAIDAVRHRILSANRDGTLSVIGFDAAGTYAPTVTVRTERGARTLALDPGTGRIFTVTATVDGSRPPVTLRGAARWSFEPGTAHVLFIDPRLP